MPTNDSLDSQANYYALIKELAIKQGWISISLAQRTFRLSYGYTLSIIQALQHKGIIGPAEATGKHPLIQSVTTEGTIEMTDTPTVTKADMPALALQALDGLLDQPGGVVYSSHETIWPGRIYFLGLNPGGSGGSSIRENIAQMLTCDQNAYLDYEWEGKEPGSALLQRRIQWTLETLGANTQDVFATNLIFIQSPNSKSLTVNQAEQCWPVHEAFLKIVQPSLIVACGNTSNLSAYSFIHSRFGGEQTYHPAGHGDWNLKRFQTTINGRKTTVIGLPHLSYYKPDGKPSVEAWLKESLEKS